MSPLYGYVQANQVSYESKAAAFDAYAEASKRGIPVANISIRWFALHNDRRVAQQAERFEHRDDILGGYRAGEPFIRILADMSADRTHRVVLHELCHFYQHLTGTYKGIPEAVQDDYTERMARIFEEPELPCTAWEFEKLAFEGVMAEINKPKAKPTKQHRPTDAVAAAMQDAFIASRRLEDARAKSTCGMKCASVERGAIVNKGSSCQGNDCQGSRLGAAVTAAKDGLKRAYHRQVDGKAHSSRVTARIRASSPPAARAIYEARMAVHRSRTA